MGATNNQLLSVFYYKKVALRYKNDLTIYTSHLLKAFVVRDYTG